MAYDGWIEYDGAELVNLSRTAQLAAVLGIDTVWTDPDSVQWIQDALGGVDYDLITEAPWYDPDYPASGEFAGIIPLAFAGLDDSTREAVTVEYITDGGSSGRSRNKTKAIVASVALVASTSRGAEFGKRWLDRMLRGSGGSRHCGGAEMRYFRWAQGDEEPVPPKAHRRDVSLSRGTSVTRKRSNHCSATWLVTYTWTANDPFEYGEAEPRLDGLGDPLGAIVPEFGAPPTIGYGTQAMTEQACPVYDYSPIYDPLHPALVPAPEAPDFYPAGWDLLPGAGFTRYWARIQSVEPSTSDVVPVVTLTAAAEARMVRLSIWPSDATAYAICDPLWTAIVSYLPPSVDFVIDGEQQAAYAWDGVSANVRRTDSLVYGTGARPIEWSAFNDTDHLLVTLDVMTGAGYDGGGTVRAALSLVPKSD